MLTISLYSIKQQHLLRIILISGAMNISFCCLKLGFTLISHCNQEAEATYKLHNKRMTQYRHQYYL